MTTRRRTQRWMYCPLRPRGRYAAQQVLRRQPPTGRRPSIRLYCRPTRDQHRTASTEMAGLQLVASVAIRSLARLINTCCLLSTAGSCSTSVGGVAPERQVGPKFMNSYQWFRFAIHNMAVMFRVASSLRYTSSSLELKLKYEKEPIMDSFSHILLLVIGLRSRTWIDWW